MNFLVVDDSKAIRWLMACGSNSSVTIRIRSEAVPSAVVSGPDRNVDLVLLDFTMPEMDGMETFLRIRESWSEIPVVMVTSLESTAPTE